MGQYRQWLYHREVDQQLRAKLAMLEQNLHSIHEQAALLENAASWIDNPIIQAIAMQQSSEALLAVTASDPYSMSENTTDMEQLPHTISPALFAWSHLPNFDTEEIHLQNTHISKHEEPQPVPHPLAEANLLPKDIASFIDTHTHAIPQLPIHINTPDTITSQEPKIASGDRTDYSIERWIERWGRKPPTTPHQTYTPHQHQLQEDTGE